MNPVVIIGAGPAGLTAATELQRAGHPHITVLEASNDIGGISKTVNFKGNRIDIGGHRFFSKSDWVMDWWREQMPIALPPAQASEGNFRLAYQGAERLLGSDKIRAQEGDDGVMLVRNRLSRILFSGKFFDYPLKPGVDTALKLGPVKCLKFGASYAASMVSPIQPEQSLEDFFINRFGRQLYLQFFKEYTEKVWGVPCNEISAAWGAQRIKSLSVTKMLAHAMRKAVGRGGAAEQTSLIEHFLYPKLGPGQMWETVADKFEKAGGQLIREARVVQLDRDDNRLSGVAYARPDGSVERIAAAHVVSTMPIRELTQAMSPALDASVSEIGNQLQYRDFITVGVLYRKLMKSSASLNDRNHLVPDNWIYVQEPGVKVGRLQIFNNWSPYMVADPDTVWVGMEFFARDDDALWAMSDEALKALALREMAEIGMAHPDDALDATVLRMPKAYPGYFGSAYAQFDKLQAALDGISNLYLIGRNGMHRYNNQDHSMLSAKLAAECILAGGGDKAPIWAINIDDEYHEEKS
ncbi:NAD(P)/FAD-dependent oxidoreductase [Ideonella sp.]|uniref:NAD(P)/FAD-dependent oxidoreductase n=1 Tax=Ideonella sp. TaxID=1929293 RepID=UPI003BB7D7A6